MDTKAVTAQALRNALLARGMTLTAFAREAGITQSNMSEILRGKSYVGPRVRERLASAYERLHLDEVQADEKPVFTVRIHRTQVNHEARDEV